MKSKLVHTSWIVVVLFLFMQFKQVNHTNPPVTGTIEAPEQVMTILRKSCFDCHSNETVWPWYSYVAPVSWLVASDVEDGRRHLNFSVWDTYNERRRNHKIKECGEEVEEGEMPLKIYLPAHPEAKLTSAEVETIVSWSKGEL